ncbi:DUF1289 domain-containing protein [Marinomonas sp. 2405UD68-3]|uniref:DUF1289 domain-containing protein n=1 Tax=Marinomonas sp. 2405UD68-3 TaxID=3391835 RepID=UPI0039C9CB14
MEQIELFQVESPCRGICQNSAKGFCKGCLRSREERYQWFTLSEVEKRKVLQTCKHRWQRLLKARQDKLDSLDNAKSLPYGMTEEGMQSLFDDIE